MSKKDMNHEKHEMHERGKHENFRNFRTFRGYESYKPSGVEWLGDVPEHWGKFRISDLARYGKKTFIDGDWIESPYITAEGVRLLQTGNVGIGKYKEQGYRYISEETFKELDCTEINPGDVLICRLADPVGRACIAPKLNERMITSVDVAILKLRSQHLNKYIVYALSSDQYLNYLAMLCRGGTRDRVSRSMLGQIRISLPPLPEQQAIAAFLDRETGRIDALIAKKERLLELLAEQRTALISATVTGKINVNHEKHEMHEKGKNENFRDFRAFRGYESYKPSGVEWLGDVPEHWGNIALKWASVRYSGGTPDKSIQEYWEDGTIPWLNSGAVNDGYITEPSEYITKEAFQNSSAKWIPKGALVMALAGQGKTKGMVAQLGFRTTCNQSMAAIIPNEKLNPRMLYWWLTKNYTNIRNLAGGEARDGLNLDLIGSIPIPLPPLTEQQAIAAFLDRETAKIDALSAKVTTVIERLKEYRTALISSVVTGKIDVRETV